MASTRTPKKLNADGLWEYALRALGMRAHSTAELKRKLIRRAATVEDVNRALEKLHAYGMTDDKKFSESFASARLSNEGFGRFRVLRDLRSKQVSQTVAQEAVEKVFSGTEEYQLAENFLGRKYRGRDLRVFLAEERNLASAYRRLRTAGFSSSVSLSLLKRYSRRAEEWSESDEGEATDA